MISLTIIHKKNMNEITNFCQCSYLIENLGYLWTIGSLQKHLESQTHIYLSLRKWIRTHLSAELLDKIAKILCLNKARTFLNC